MSDPAFYSFATSVPLDEWAKDQLWTKNKKKLLATTSLLEKIKQKFEFLS
jgi:hypothetical protein